MYQEVLSKYDVLTVAEGLGVTTENALDYVDPERKELNLLYHFDGVGLGLIPGEFKTPDPNGYNLVDFKKLYSRWDRVFAERGWGTIYLGNHDNPRMVTRWGNDSPAFRDLSSKMLTTFLLTMRATPFYYFGDELGMTNIKFDSIDDYQDIETRNMHLQITEKGGDLGWFMNNQKITARDNGRTPFQWDDSENAGFTSGKPWLKVNPNFKDLNAKKQEKDPGSVLNYFKELIKLRKEELSVVYGNYFLLDEENPDSFSYIRHLGDIKLLIILNFKPYSVQMSLNNIDFNDSCILLNNYGNPSSDLRLLRAYEAVILKLKR